MLLEQDCSKFEITNYANFWQFAGECIYGKMYVQRQTDRHGSIRVGLTQAHTNYLSSQPAIRPPGFNIGQTHTSLVSHTHSALSNKCSCKSESEFILNSDLVSPSHFNLTHNKKSHQVLWGIIIWKSSLSWDEAVPQRYARKAFQTITLFFFKMKIVYIDHLIAGVIK